MDENGRADVLVVGAGPVGLVLACELARRGTSIRLIDKLTSPTDESRAIVVHARSLEMMERIGTVDALTQSGIVSTAAEFHADGKVLGRVELDTVDSPYPFAISTAQTETERVHRERLEELGGTVDRGVALVGFEQDEDEVRSRLRHPDGSEEAYSSSWIAGTDGSHSTVRSQLGMKLEGSFKGETFLLGDVEADTDLPREAFHLFLSAPGLLVVFPMRGERLRVIAQVDDGGAEETVEELQQLCAERAGGIELRSSHWITSFEIHHAQVPRYRHGRAFLAGDAAHVHSPAGGQGMNTGMQDAFNLGWKLSAAAAGRAAPGLLDSYHDERHPIAARVIEQTTRLTSIGTPRRAFARTLRNLAFHVATGLAPVQRKLAAEVEMTSVAYPDSPIVVRPRKGVSGPRPGDAAPDVHGLDPPLHSVLAADSGHTALYIAGANGRPVRLTPEREDMRHVLVGEAGAPESFDERLPDPGGHVAERYGIGDRGGLVLVRPDGYVGLRAELDDAAAASAYLDGVYGAG
jgi:2-polyprenyl-6-methoxyphenol hydroxylase-like FAD-dependent oxidoreductase